MCIRDRHTGVRSRRELAELLRLYDAEIRYTDHLVGQMCAYLKKRGWYDDCAVILSADHGEQYGCLLYTSSRWSTSVLS